MLSLLENVIKAHLRRSKEAIVMGFTIRNIDSFNTLMRNILAKAQENEYLFQEKGFENNLDYLIHLYKEIMTPSWHNQDDHWKINDCFEHFKKAYKAFDQYYTIGNALYRYSRSWKTWSISVHYRRTYDS